MSTETSFESAMMNMNITEFRPFVWRYYGDTYKMEDLKNMFPTLKIVKLYNNCYHLTLLDADQIKNT